jgi:hypothetical protein
MIIVSSFRPFETCSNIVWLQQEAANRSWVRLFDRIFYFNHSDTRMKSAKTAFLPTNGKPAIKKLAAFCGGLNDWSCLVNADIVIPQNFRRVEEALRGQPAGCAVSRRYTLPADGDTATARLTDLGLDFFAATNTVWKAVAEKIPEGFCLGRTKWDNWVLNFFMAEFGNHCYDLTNSRVVFHPMHEDRADQNWDYPKDDPYLNKNNWPFHAIEI